MTATYDFGDCFRRGKKGESIVVAALRSRDDWRVERQADSRLEQAIHGIDYIANYDGHRHGLEIKTDCKGFETKRVPLEMEHVDRFGDSKPGWLRKTTASFVIALHAPKHLLDAMPDAERLITVAWRDDFPMRCDNARLLVLRTEVLRAHFDEWKGSRPLSSAANGSYVTWNVCVAIPQLERSDAVVAMYRARFGFSVETRQMGAVAETIQKQRGLFG